MTGFDEKILEYFPGKVVRKDLTALMKKGANVPTYVLEYLLGAPGNLDSSLCFFQSSVSHDVLCIEVK